MSHELRTPLNAILGFSQLMATNQGMDTEQRENVGIINRSGEHLLTLINQILDLSKVEAGQTSLNQQELDFYRLLDDLINMFQMRANDKGLAFVFDRDPAVPRYVGVDGVKLRQVLINLLSNAFKFTPQGAVSVHVMLGENWLKSEEKTEHHEPKAQICFEVGDTGPGIPSDELEYIFEAFAQTKPGKNAQEGAGLGLSISQEFVRLMGGEMSVISELGEGKVFTFCIPVSVANAWDIQNLEPEQKVVAVVPGQPASRILVVDDRPDNRQLLLRILKLPGFEVQEACNGQEAVAIWKTWKPHLIWMDMWMPVMDGKEAVQVILAEELAASYPGNTHKTAIISLSASSSKADQEAALNAGCDDFMSKPIRKFSLFDVMKIHLGIQYVYEDDEIHADPSHRPPEAAKSSSQTTEALTALPPDLLTWLEKVSIVGGISRLLKLIDEISHYDPPLGDKLAKLADDFDYGRILKLIQNAKNSE
ncbi:MAG: hypothetical protein B6245_19300 [Desulfobacteraceae bacterium 4572_88]|nr:MAG: hypothetical protein B6245_19300 [Desulfobacteraceae bacterium 4572_88]